MSSFDDRADPSRALRALAFVSCALLLTWSSSIASAQDNVSGYTVRAERQIRIGENHMQLTGGVELEQEDTKLYADSVEWFMNEDMAIAIGNVVFSHGNNRIAAERAELNTKTHLGTFYEARGIASVQQPRRAPAPGAFTVPMLAGSELDVYFFGEQIVVAGSIFLLGDVMKELRRS